MYPLYRYPSSKSANALRSIRALKMNMKIVEEVCVKHGNGVNVSKLRLIVELKVTLSLDERSRVSMRTPGGRIAMSADGDITFGAVHGRGSLTEQQKNFLKEMVVQHLEDPEGDVWDGLDLLRTVATMPSQFRSPGKDLEWFRLMPSHAEVPAESVLADHPSLVREM